MLSQALADLQSFGASLFTQQNRLLRLRFAESSQISAHSLLPALFSGEEGLSRCYRYQLDCLSIDAHLALKDIHGQSIEIGLLLPGDGERLFTGLVTAIQAIGSDGTFARYRLIIEPALATLTHRRNSRVFSDKSVPQIIAAILDEHLASNRAFASSFRHHSRLTRTYPQRSYCLQYRESDLAFIERLAAEEGISYTFTHGPDPDASIGMDSEQTDSPLHTLIFFDPGHSPAQVSTDSIRFHRTEGVESDDAIDTWEAHRRLQSSESSLNAYDYKTANRYPASEAQRTRHGGASANLSANLEDYDPQAPYYGSDHEEVARYATLRQQAKDFVSKTFTGGGTSRRLEVGKWFELEDHPVHDADIREDRQFFITGLHFEARNNLPMQGAQRASMEAAQIDPPYRNTFTAVRRHIPVVPAFHLTRHQKPVAPGATTATVVGPEGEEIFTDEHGRIKIQFHWQRPQDHPEGEADATDRSSTWIRVAYPSAGADWGTQHIPRIGQECLVSFLENDIDRPIVTGIIYNGSHRPPTFSGAGQLPANKTLSGHKSKEYRGRGYNELLFDDTTNELRAKLSTEHGKTQLNQGYLVHPRSNGKTEPRGEGFELRTDDAGAIRAAKGLLLSAWQRLNASSTQLSRDEALSLMDTCLDLFKQFGQYAADHQALPLDPAPQTALKDAFKNWEHGSNAAPQAAPAGGDPIIGMSAPAGLAFTTPESQVSYAGRNHDTVAQQHLQLTAGQRFNLNAGKGISLFSHADGLKAIAHHGKLQLQSQHDDTEIAAEQNIKLTASTGRIVGMAEKEIVFITSGGAYLKLNGANIELGAPGTFKLKAASHHWDGPASMATDLPAFGAGELGRKFRLVRPGDGQPVADRPFKITLADGSVKEGLTNSAGETDLLESDRFKIADIQFFDPTSLT